MTGRYEQKQEPLLKARVLAHIARYKLTLPEVVARQFFPAHVYPNKTEAVALATTYLEGLVKSGELITGQCPGKSKVDRPQYYLLAGSNPGEGAVNADISILWFSYFGKTVRFRLTRDDLSSVLTDLPYKNITHTIEGTRDVESVKLSGVIWRMAPTMAEVKEIMRNAKRHLKKARKKFERLVDDGDYGFAFLCDTEAKAESILSEFEKPQPDGSPPLSHQARFLVEVCPRADTLSKTLAER